MWGNRSFASLNWYNTPALYKYIHHTTIITHKDRATVVISINTIICDIMINWLQGIIQLLIPPNYAKL